MQKLSIIIPIFNERKTILEILRKIEKVVLDGIEKEIIIVDDFSTDGTRDTLKELESKYRVIYHDKNLGKGKSVRDGLMEVSGDWTIIQDADLEYNPKEYPILLSSLLDNKVDAVYGSRFALNQNGHSIPLYLLGNRFLTFFSNIFTHLHLTDMETCYKLLSRRAVLAVRNELSSNGFEIEPEITALLAKKRMSIVEVPISYNSRSHIEGKKIRLLDGFSAIWAIIKFNLFT